MTGQKYSRKRAPGSPQLHLAGTEASEYRCSSCGAKSTTPRSKCVVCKRWGTFTVAGSMDDDSTGWNPQRLARIKTDKVERVNLRDPALAEMFGGGPVRSCSYLFDAPPGFGKTTWALQASTFFRAPLYVTGEQSKGEIKLYAKRMGLDLPDLDIVETRDMEMVAANISDAYDALILDSVHRMRCDDSNAGIGSSDQVEAVIALGADICRKLGIVGFFIGHQNKDGEGSGKRANEHEVAGVIHGHKCTDLKSKRTSKRRIMTIDKHRHGPDPCTVECVMTERGLDGFTVIREDEES